ncbi:hypothetical protein [Paraburkholderia denitrificans]
MPVTLKIGVEQADNATPIVAFGLTLDGAERIRQVLSLRAPLITTRQLEFALPIPHFPPHFSSRDDTTRIGVSRAAVSENPTYPIAIVWLSCLYN